MSRSIYCENCRLLLGNNKKLSKDEAETIKLCKCLASVRKSEKEKKFLSYKEWGSQNSNLTKLKENKYG